MCHRLCREGAEIHAVSRKPQVDDRGEILWWCADFRDTQAARSLLAAVQPADTSALYFVATGRGDGAHQFSSTLEEHNSAVQTYLERLRRQRPVHGP